jgi:Ca-activated chloride channel family protein
LKEPSLLLSRALIFLALAIPFLWSEESALSGGEKNSGHPGTEKQVPGQSDTIRVHTSLVLVPVSVFDGRGRAVKDLELEDFAVFENSSPVKIERLREPGLSKLDMVLVFDVTGSTRTHFNFARQAATSFLRSLFRSGDSVSILCIASDPEIILERTESLSDSLDGLNRLQPFGAATAFFDSIFAATRLFYDPADEETRRVMVVLSDGEDNLSRMNLADTLQSIQRADCIFYSINPGEISASLSRVSRRGHKWMETLAEQTGGSAFFAESLEDLGDIYKRIADELQVQYLLGYYSPNPRADGSFRSIRVEIRKQPELRVRARKGYYADRLVSR